MLDYLAFRRASKRLFNTADGKVWLAYMKSDKVDRSAFGKTDIETNQKLAVKEFVQAICNDVSNPEELDEIIIDNI